MKQVIDYIHTIPGITAVQVNTLVSMIEDIVDKRKVKKANRKAG